ncbi:MAG: beta family protein [Clostridia bacterium]|nr:beta family protein [Clostridia bacterium]
MDFKYVPILKNRREELSVLKTLFKMPISTKILPLLEIVQDKAQKNSKTLFYEDLEEFANPDIPFMVDIRKMARPTGTSPTVKQFLTKVKRDVNYQLDLFKKLHKIRNLIPVISYDPNDYDSNEIINTDKELRKIGYDRIAYRLTINYFTVPYSEIIKVIKDNDILILDLETVKYSNPDHMDKYNKVKNLKLSKKISLVLVHSVLKKDMTNTGLVNGEKIDGLNDGIKKHYSSYGFDAFGDYTCVKGELPPSGGMISPGFIFYSWKNDCYIGFKGREPKLTEFKDYIVPNVLKSSYWNEYSNSHRDKCPGCFKVLEVKNGFDDGKNQGLWKRISMLHYIYTMDELL